MAHPPMPYPVRPAVEAVAVEAALTLVPVVAQGQAAAEAGPVLQAA
ncbi:hypothetical protein [Sphingomonas sp. LT1P40]